MFKLSWFRAKVCLGFRVEGLGFCRACGFVGCEMYGFQG